MPKTKKHSAIRQAKPTVKRKNNITSNTAAETDVNSDQNSPDVQISESDDAFENDEDGSDDEDAETHLHNVQEKIDTVQKLVKDNKKKAKDFEDRIEQDRLRILGTIAQQRDKINDEQNTFSTAFLTATLSALQPLSLSPNDNSTTPNMANKIRTSTIGANNVDLFKFSEKLCENTVQLLRIYNGLPRRCGKDARTATMRKELAKDKSSVVDLTKAGAKRVKQQILDKLCDKAQTADAAIELTAQEQGHAQLFERYSSTVTVPVIVGDGLERFTQVLTMGISAIEGVVKN